ncbi:hypothetical protein BpHYR1_043443 [Brachionus plicatilis]|uniref:Uncharacterized protein n=1 Tax=Brachionus plicatilis TaxID=10195 RepID=A0A3M7P4U3_BRAPC|nr:hypothetical protein BpHYR1_043443 [Brachionus plicatilis]
MPMILLCRDISFFGFISLKNVEKEKNPLSIKLYLLCSILPFFDCHVTLNRTLIGSIYCQVVLNFDNSPINMIPTWNVSIQTVPFNENKNLKIFKCYELLLVRLQLKGIPVTDYIYLRTLPCSIASDVKKIKYHLKAKNS